MPGPSSSTLDARPRRRRAAPRGDGRTGGRVGARVGQQVRHDLVQAGRVAGTVRGSSGRSSSSCGRGPAAWASLTASTTSRVRSTGSLVQRPTSVEAREQQQVVDERRSSAVASDSTRPSACRRRGHGLALAAGQLGVPADRGQRRAQLVAGVGDELAHPHLALVPRRQRGADVVEQPVEGGADLPDLGAGVGVGRRAPARPGRPRRWSSGSSDTRVGGGRDAPQRPQGAADEPQAGDRRRPASRPSPVTTATMSARRCDRVVLRPSAARSRRCRRRSAGAGDEPVARPGRRRGRTRVRLLPTPARGDGADLRRCQRGVLARAACTPRWCWPGRHRGHLQRGPPPSPRARSRSRPRGCRASPRRPQGPSWSSPPARGRGGRRPARRAGRRGSSWSARIVVTAGGDGDGDEQRDEWSATSLPRSVHVEGRRSRPPTTSAAHVRSAGLST